MRRQEVGIIGKLRDVFEGESGGARFVMRDHQRRDLDDLAFPTGGRTGVPLRVRDVVLSLGRVAVVGGHDREECLLDCVVLHGHKVRPGADSRLTSY